jgi:hypothetical protein
MVPRENLNTMSKVIQDLVANAIQNAREGIADVKFCIDAAILDDAGWVLGIEEPKKPADYWAWIEIRETTVLWHLQEPGETPTSWEHVGDEQHTIAQLLQWAKEGHIVEVEFH